MFSPDDSVGRCEVYGTCKDLLYFSEKYKYYMKNLYKSDVDDIDVRSCDFFKVLRFNSQFIYKNINHIDLINQYQYDDNNYDSDGYKLTELKTNRLGYNRDGLKLVNNKLLNVFGRTKDGYDADGYDVNGFNKYGFDMYGFDANGFDANGFNYLSFPEKITHKFSYESFDDDSHDINKYVETPAVFDPNYEYTEYKDEYSDDSSCE